MAIKRESALIARREIPILGRSSPVLEIECTDRDGSLNGFFAISYTLPFFPSISQYMFRSLGVFSSVRLKPSSVLPIELP